MIPHKWEKRALVSAPMIYNCWTLYISGSLIRPVRTLVGKPAHWSHWEDLMKTVVLWIISAVTTKPSDQKVRRNRLHSSFTAKQSVCKMSGSVAQDKCAAGLTPGLKRNHSSQGLVSQSWVRASRHQGLLALRSPQGLSWGDGYNAFSLSSPLVKHFVIGMKPKRTEQLGLKIHFNSSVHCYLYRVFCNQRRRVLNREEARAEQVRGADQQLRTGIGHTCQ